MNKVMFRCDGGPGIGLGHVMRCKALAATFEKRGWHTGFAMGAASAAHFPELSPTVVADGDDGAIAIVRRLAGGEARCMIVDDYRLGAAFEGACRAAGVTVVAIDDLADRPHDCAILVDSNPARVEEDYRTLAPGAQLLLGTRYAMLRSQFAEQRVIGSVAPVARKLLVLPGGADPSDISSRFLDLLRDLDDVFDTTLVVGKVNPRRDALLVEAADVGAEVAVDPANLVALMASADIAVSGAGTTCLELACLGTPTLALVLADNQRSIAAALDRAGTARVLGEGFEPATIAAHLRALAADRAARQTLRDAAQSLVDGRGAQRIADAALNVAFRK